MTANMIELNKHTYIDRDAAKSLWSNDHPTSIAMRRIFDDLPTADVNIYIPVVKDDNTMETETLGAFSNYDVAVGKLAESISAAHRETCTMMIEHYLLDGKYLGTTYPFEQLDKEDDSDDEN